MKKHLPNMPEGDDGIIVLGKHEPQRTFTRRLFHWVGQVILWVLACTPGLLIIAYGVGGVHNERLVGIGRFKSVSYGGDAVGWGWIFIGIGLWALGQGIDLKTGRSLLKLPFNILAACAVIVGAWVLFRRFL